MSFLRSVGNFAAGVAKSEGKRLARRGISALEARYLGGCVGGAVRTRSRKGRKARFVKGSAAAKAHMAIVRAKRTLAGCMRGCRRQF